MDILFISLPSFWGRRYVCVENYWMITFAQYLSSYGYKVSTLDASLKGQNLHDIQNHVLQVKPKILVYLVSKKNWKVVCQAKRNIIADINLLLWDDSVTLNEACSFISEDNHTININLDDLFDLICRILPAVNTSQLYSDNTLLVGRNCLKHVLLEGGECEVVMQMPKRKWFPSDYVFNAEHALFKSNIEKTQLEIITLCRKFSLRKINIIHLDLIPNEIEKIQALLKENTLDYVRLGIYMTSSSLTDKMCDYLIEKRGLLYKIIILSDVMTYDQLTKFHKLKEYKIKTKVIFALFHEQATIDSVQSAINSIRQGDFQVAPTTLIAGAPSDQMLAQIQSIMRVLFFKIFLPYHQKIIEYENNKKYELRIGKSQQYASIPAIQRQVESLSQSLNNIFLSMLEDLLSHLTLRIDAPGHIIIDLLNKYKDRIQKVGDDINDYLFASRRI